MVSIIIDPSLEGQLIAERQATGADRYDEVWDGVYIMAPQANSEHQDLVGDISAIFKITVDWPGSGRVLPGANVSDREEGWEHNYRCPDVVVFLDDTRALDCGTHWYGGPDFVVEIVSDRDKTFDKLPFYSQIGTRELLVIDRNPWTLILYRLRETELVEVGRSTLEDTNVLESEIVPLTWQLVVSDSRPAIAVVREDGTERWLIEPTDAPTDQDRSVD